MRPKTSSLPLFWIVLLLAGCEATNCYTRRETAVRESSGRETLYQVSTLHALLAGGYDGWWSLASLQTHGDLGIGTFQGLDGEMVLLDGIVYQVRADGKVYRPDPAGRTPFACVTFFEADRRVAIERATDFEALRRRIDEAAESLALPLALRIRGHFSRVKTRSVPRQEKPYPRLAEVAETQPEFSMTDLDGTLVGFRLPEYLAGVNVPGYHLHFLDESGTRGGHVLAFVLERGTAAIDATPSFALDLPPAGGLRALESAPASAEEVEAVEQ